MGEFIRRSGIKKLSSFFFSYLYGYPQEVSFLLCSSQPSVFQGCNPLGGRKPAPVWCCLSREMPGLQLTSEQTKRHPVSDWLVMKVIFWSSNCLTLFVLLFNSELSCKKGHCLLGSFEHSRCSNIYSIIMFLTDTVATVNPDVKLTTKFRIRRWIWKGST